MNEGPARDNGRKSNGNAWMQWVNMVLLIAVSSLLGLMWTSMSDRIDKIEAKAENFSRIQLLESIVREQGLEIARLESFVGVTGTRAGSMYRRREE